MISTLTSKGQATIPKAIRDYLGLQPGCKVVFDIDPDGRAVVRAAGPGARHVSPGPARSLRGVLKSDCSTDELMALLRGYDNDASDPGFAEP